MIDHISLTVSDFDRAKAFYLAALKPLGVSVMMEVSAAETSIITLTPSGLRAAR